jgi:hypothetical protein
MKVSGGAVNGEFSLPAKSRSDRNRRNPHGASPRPQKSGFSAIGM